jgi:predicted ATPase
MQAAFGSAFQELNFPPALDQYIQMRIQWKDLTWQQPAAALSDGILRYLFIIAALISPWPPSLICIDEPEIGFHPGVFPIIAEYAADAAKRSQVIFTTHSPEFLNAFDEVAVPTVTVFDWHDGATEMRKVSGDKLKYWLEKYKLGEMFRDGDLEIISDGDTEAAS